MVEHSRRQALVGLAASPVLLSESACALPVSADQSIDPRKYGAKCDGIADDSDAIQRSIRECLSSNPPTPLIVPGPCLIKRSINLDREVDKSSQYFRIFGLGPAAGFVTDRPIAIFDSAISVEQDPRSAGFWFSNITFQGRHPEATVATGKLLRVTFSHCEFSAIRCLKTTLYAQEWAFFACYATRWSGIFFSSAGGYRVISSASKYQFGGSGFYIVDPTRQKAGCVGCSFLQDSYESNDGPFVTADQARALTVQSLYSEGNNDCVLDFSLKGPNRGIIVSGCLFNARDINRAKENFAEIQWGVTLSGTSISNVSEGRLHGGGQMKTGALISIGDTIINP